MYCFVKIQASFGFAAAVVASVPSFDVASLQTAAVPAVVVAFGIPSLLAFPFSLFP